MMKHLVLAAFLTCGAATAYAQPQQATSPPAPGTTTTILPGRDMPAPTESGDTRKLIGRSVQNAQNETIGEIKSVYIGPDGKVDSLIVRVGGFLGVGEREVRLAWSDLKISDNSEKVVLDITKDELKAKPEYMYSNAGWRGQVFSDKGPWTAGDPNRVARDRAASERMSANRNAASTTSTADFNANGEISGNAFIGANIRNRNNETVGKVEDVYIDDRGTIKTVVVSVGGFLGMGTKDVAVKWSDIKHSRDGKSLVLTTNWTKDSLKAMPDYKYERRQTQR
jgi:sporulation protein YlmC with PRC-barrel domain